MPVSISRRIFVTSPLLRVRVWRVGGWNKLTGHVPAIASGRHFSLRKCAVLRRRSRCADVYRLFSSPAFTFARVVASFNPVRPSLTTTLASSSELTKLLRGSCLRERADPGPRCYLNQPEVRSIYSWSWTPHPAGVLHLRQPVATAVSIMASLVTSVIDKVMYRRLNFCRRGLVYCLQ